MDDKQKFETWGLLELFGHQRLAGKMTEQTIAGTGFIRIDVPAVDGVAEYSRIFGTAAIYGITPTSEEIARQLAKGMQATPIHAYELQRLPGPARHNDDPDPGEF